MASFDELALEKEVLARPEADEPRRELAELLVRRGDPRGGLIQVQLDIARIHRAQGSTAELAGLTPRERALLRGHQAEWTSELPLLRAAVGRARPLASRRNRRHHDLR